MVSQRRAPTSANSSALPKLTTEWHGRAIKGKWAELAKAGVVPKKECDGSSDVEQIIDSIPEDQRSGKSYEQLPADGCATSAPAWSWRTRWRGCARA